MDSLNVITEIVANLIKDSRTKTGSRSGVFIGTPMLIFNICVDQDLNLNGISNCYQ